VPTAAASGSSRCAGGPHERARARARSGARRPGIHRAPPPRAAGFSSGSHDRPARRAARVGQQLDHPRPSARNLASRSPTSTVTGIQARPACPTAAPSRRCRCPAAPPPAPRAVAALILARERADLGRALGEQRLAAPALDEAPRRDPARARRRAPVGEAARRARSDGVLDAGAGGDEHEPRHALGRLQRHVQSDAPAQRVAAQHEALGGAGEHVATQPANVIGPLRRRPPRRARAGRAPAAGSVPGRAPRSRRPRRDGCR
jgi:hypothetical protein